MSGSKPGLGFSWFALPGHAHVQGRSAWTCATALADLVQKGKAEVLKAVSHETLMINPKSNFYYIEDPENFALIGYGCHRHSGAFIARILLAPV